MRGLGAVTVVVLALSAVAAALAAAPAGPQYGVYTAHVAVGGGGQTLDDIKVLDPVTKVTLTLDCGRPSGARTVTEVWNSPIIPLLRGGSFSFHGTVSIERFTTATGTNALVSRTSFRGVVDAQGAFNRTFDHVHGQFVGTLSIAGSPCAATRYTASWLPGPTPG